MEATPIRVPPFSGFTTMETNAAIVFGFDSEATVFPLLRPVGKLAGVEVADFIGESGVK